MSREDDGRARERRESTMVFVRNLPYDADDAALEDAFSNAFGPVKECWTVAERGSTTRRGFGYVKFAIAEDAAEAVKASGTIEIGGRKLGVSVARPKVTEGRGGGGGGGGGGAEEREAAAPVKVERAKPKATVKKMVVGASSAKEAMRTVVIGGLKIGGEIEGVDADAAKALARGAGEIVSVTEPCPEDVMKAAKIREDGCTRGALLAVFKDEATARKAVQVLHGKSPKSKKEKKKGKKSGGEDADGDAGREKIWARALAGEGSKPKQWRVIVRNLSFKATEASIREAMSAAGFVWEINVPKDFHNKPKGFAFVTYTSKADADKAVSECNGVSIEGRQVAVDVALSKSKFREQEEAAPNVATTADEKDGNDGAASDGSDSDDDDGDDEASSSSSSEEEDEEVKEKNMVSRLLGKMMANEEPEASKPAEKKKKLPTEKNDIAKPAGDASAEPSWQGRKGVDDESGDGVAENATVFVRNLPLEATWQQLKEKMEKYGKVKSCRVVKDKITGKHVGNAFVDFTNAAAASSAIEAGSSESAGIFVAGRPITVALAVSKTEAQDMMARQGAKYRNANKHRDNRNLYLATEGDIHEASSAADGVSKSDIEKRRRSNEERQLKLKNPNFFVSRTRLSVRNIPPEIDSKALKKMFIEAVQKRATHSTPKVLHAKLLYETDKMDENGKPRSKGMGFVEFSEHEHALTALRALNNNPDAFSRARRPIVEFAIEDARAVRKLELKAKRREEQQSKRGDGEKPRGAEQAAKRVAAKEKRSDGAPQKRPRDGDGERRDRSKPTGAPRRDTSDAEPRAKKLKKRDTSAPDASAAAKLQKRAAEANKRDARDARRAVDEKPRKKPHGVDKRDRTDDLIDAYFSKDSGLKSWL